MVEIVDSPIRVKELVLSPWEIYARQVASRLAQEKGMKVPQAKVVTRFEDGLRKSPSGRVLPIEWSAYEVEDGDFPEFESVVATAEAYFLERKASDDPSDAGFRSNPSRLDELTRSKFETEIGQVVEDIALITRHSDPSVLE